MRIAIFTDCYTPVKNGVVTSIRELKTGLEAKGHHVIVFTVQVKGYNDQESGIIRFRSIPIGLGTEIAFGLVNQFTVNRMIRSHKIEIIHIHTELNLCISGMLAAHKFALPRIHTTHTLWEEYRHYLLNGILLSPTLIRVLAKLILRGSAGLVAPSVKAKNYYQPIVPDTPFEVIPNGMDRTKFGYKPFTLQEINEIRKRWSIIPKDKVILFVGRIGKEKRVVELFNAILPVLKANLQTKMVFVGDGPCRKELESRSCNLKLGERILFTGYVDWESVHELYSLSNLFVTASMSEVHSMTMIEAMMCSLPIVARRDESFIASVTDGINGYLAESDGDLTEKILQVVNNEEKLQHMGEESLRVSKKYSGAAHANRMEKFYEHILSHDACRNSAH